MEGTQLKSGSMWNEPLPASRAHTFPLHALYVLQGAATGKGHGAVLTAGGTLSGGRCRPSQPPNCVAFGQVQ